MTEITCEVIYATAPVPAIGVVHDWDSGTTLFLSYGPGGTWIPRQSSIGDSFRDVPADFVVDEDIVRVLNIRLKTAVKPTQDLRPHTIRR